MPKPITNASAARPWTAADLAVLRRDYPHQPTAQIAAQLGRSVGQVYQAAERRGLRKSAEYMAGPFAFRLRRGDDTGIAHRFQPGDVPWNKGKPGTTGLHPNTAAHHFQPGRPASDSRNYRPIGSLRVCRDGYLERKMTDDPALPPVRRWTAVHRLVWEAAHGPIPAGHAVVFRPGQKTTDAQQITLDRLELVTRAELMRRNSYHTHLPPELARVVQLRGAISRQINKLSKGQA